MRDLEALEGGCLKGCVWERRGHKGARLRSLAWMEGEGGRDWAMKDGVER